MVKQIIEWGNKINLFQKSNIEAQNIKFVEEMGEAALAYRKNDTDELLDGLGDMIVVATNILYFKQIDIDTIDMIFKDSIKEDHMWITDKGTKSFDILLNQACQFKLDVFNFVKSSLITYRSLIMACNTFCLLITNGEQNIQNVLSEKVLKIINARVDGIIIDDKGFAIKAEDRI